MNKKIIRRKKKIKYFKEKLCFSLLLLMMTFLPIINPTSDNGGGLLEVDGDSETLLEETPLISESTSWTANGTVICNAIDEQEEVQIVSDGSGGAIITWYDNRGSNSDIYAQRINSEGAIQWTTNGTAICNTTDAQYSPQLASDGSGGAIITWYDFRSGNRDIYAQRINSTGAIQWTANGTVICNATEHQWNHQIVSDGSGGAIITWQDYRGSNYDIYAQRINATGAIQWTANGTVICNATKGQYSPEIISDGSGGAIITWYDNRGSTRDIYAQRINATGAIQWTANGTVICDATGDQYFPELVSDGSEGAIITWKDNRGSTSDIYAQGINSAGAVQWTANGTVICNAIDKQEEVQIVSDGSGGAIITWEDDRGSTRDIYAQGINSAGAVQWTANGTVICTAGGQQIKPQIVSDGSRGAIITWCDIRSVGNRNIYAQRIIPDSTPVDGDDDDDDDSSPSPKAIPGFNLMIIGMILAISVISVVKMLNRKNKIVHR